MKKVDLTGQQFGRLIVTGEAPNLPGNKNLRWTCKCDCGKEIIVFGMNLRNGHTKSCGCFLADLDIAKNTTHGQADGRLYRIWRHMKERCSLPNNKHFRRYGGRGITVCPEWQDSFEAFYVWAMAHGYKDDLTIDRIDNDGDYTPENCRWVTQAAQNRNTRQNVTYTVAGITKTQREWEYIIGVYRGKLWKLEKAGKDVEAFIREKLEENHV